MREQSCQQSRGLGTLPAANKTTEGLDTPIVADASEHMYIKANCQQVVVAEPRTQQR